jgi:hypothetical protein
VYGNLHAVGTADNKIYFTSIYDDTAGGDTNEDGASTAPSSGAWGRLAILTDSVSEFAFSVVQYGGNGFQGAVYNKGNLTMSHSRVLDSNNSGIFQQGFGTLHLSSSEFARSQTYGIQAGIGVLDLANSSIHDNGVGGVSAVPGFGPVVANDNYWGSPDDPNGTSAINGFTVDTWLIEAPNIDGVMDTVKPVTSPTITGTQTDVESGWYTSGTTLALSATDDASGVASTMYSLDGGATFVPYVSPLTFSDGVHTVLYKSTDVAGNTEDTQTQVINVDTVSPVTEKTVTGTLGMNGWYNTTTSVSLAGADAGSGLSLIEYSTDNGATWHPYTTALSFDNDVAHIAYRSKDVAGNAEAAHNFDVNVDTTAPVTTVNVDGQPGSDGWNVSDSIVTLTASDNLSTVLKTEYSVDGGSFALYTGAITVGSGTHTIAFKSTDTAGNVEEVQSVVDKVDSSVPVTTLAVEGMLGSGDWYTTSPTITFTAVSNPSGIANTKYSINGASFVTYTSPFSLTDGTYSIQFKSTNNAGTVEPIQTKVIQVDTTKPVISHTVACTLGANGWCVSSATFTITATDTTSGVSAKEYSTDNGATWNTYTGPISYVNDGVTSLLYRATDAAGNMTTANSLTVKVDTTAPEANIIFDKTTQDLKVTGIDAIGSTTTIFTTTYALVTDESGHSVKIGFDKYKDTSGKVKVVLSYVRYNGATSGGAVPHRTLLRYKYSANASNVIQNLKEKVVVGNKKEVGVYQKHAGDKTKITIKTKKNNAEYNDNDDEDDDFDDDDRNCDNNSSTRQTLPGLVILGLKTNNGNLESIRQ